MLKAKYELRSRKFRLLQRLRAARGALAAQQERKRRYVLDEF